MDDSKRQATAKQNRENALLLIRAISGAIAKGCIHRDRAGNVLKTTAEVLDALQKEGGVLVENPSAEVIEERLEFTKRMWPQDRCYRNREDERHHFKIVSYDVGERQHQCSEPGCDHKADPTAVTLTVAHGADSSLPGVAWVGFSPSLLIGCGCGKWLLPSAKQMAATRARIERERNKGRS